MDFPGIFTGGIFSVRLELDFSITKVVVMKLYIRDFTFHFWKYNKSSSFIRSLVLKKILE